MAQFLYLTHLLHHCTCSWQNWSVCFSVLRCWSQRSDGAGVSVPRCGAEHQPHASGPDAQAEHGQGLQHRGAAGRRRLGGPVSREGARPEVPAHADEHRECVRLVALDAPVTCTAASRFRCQGSHHAYSLGCNVMLTHQPKCTERGSKSLWGRRKRVKHTHTHIHTHTPAE